MVLDGKFSTTISVTSGVPQGSILGPLSFILSVDPLTKLSLSKNTYLGMFADDIVLHKVIRSLEDLVCLQSDVAIIADWADTSDLRLNKNKTKCMAISREKIHQFLTFLWTLSKLNKLKPLNTLVSGSPVT